VQTQEEYQFIYQVNIYIHSIPDNAAQAQVRADSGAVPIHLSGLNIYIHSIPEKQLRLKVVQTQEQYLFIYQVNIYIHSIPDKAAQAQVHADSGVVPIHLSGQYLYPLNS
jgi:hypothetical protein